MVRYNCGDTRSKTCTKTWVRPGTAYEINLNQQVLSFGDCKFIILCAQQLLKRWSVCIGSSSTRGLAPDKAVIDCTDNLLEALCCGNWLNSRPLGSWQISSSAANLMILNAVECVKINIAERIDTTFGPCYAFRAFHTNRRMARRTEKK